MNPFQDVTTLLFWQEKLINELLKELGFQRLGLEDVYNIFNHCPVHNVELLNDNVSIINGMEYNEIIKFNLKTQLFPLATVNAPKDIDHFQYPKSLDIFYCHTCREIRLIKINSK